MSLTKDEITPLLKRLSAPSTAAEKIPNKTNIKWFLITAFIGLLLLIVLIFSQDCKLSEWSEWYDDPQNKTQKMRHRSILQNAKLLGKKCQAADLIEYKSLLTSATKKSKFSDTAPPTFSDWTTCNGGLQTRTQISNGDMYPILETRACNTTDNGPPSNDPSNTAEGGGSNNSVQICNNNLCLSLTCDGSENGSDLTFVQMPTQNATLFNLSYDDNTGAYNITSSQCAVPPDTAINTSVIAATGDGVPQLAASSDINDSSSLWTLNCTDDTKKQCTLLNLGNNQYLTIDQNNQLSWAGDINSATQWQIS